MNDKAINNLGFIFEESYENADSFLKDITYGGELYDYFYTFLFPKLYSKQYFLHNKHFSLSELTHNLMSILRQ